MPMEGKVNLRNLNEFLCSCVAVSAYTGDGLIETVIAGAKQVMNPPQMTKEQLFDWAYNSPGLVGADKEAAIRKYEAAQ